MIPATSVSSLRKRFPAMGADEKAGCADERDGGGGNVHLSDAL